MGGFVGDGTGDFGHTEQAHARRETKVRTLASFCWDRGISPADLRAMTDATRRRIARAADVHPPSSWETWGMVCDALDAKDAWAARNPDHPGAVRARPLGRAQWVESEPPPPPEQTSPVRGEAMPLFGDEE